MNHHFLRTSAILLLLMFVTALSAQNMRVTEFRLLENDLTANRYGTSKQDQNDETAALIKIVTPGTGFSFDGGALGIVAAEQKPGEIWLYVPRRAQRLTISHRVFGVLRSYVYPIPIEGARTYEMLLDLGTGRFTTIRGSRAGADIEIDGQRVGPAPVNNYYLLYGPHTIKATAGKWEGTLDHYTLPNDTTGKQQTVLTVAMTDQSAHYGQGRITVDGNADIYHANERVGSPGYWDFDLREGTYEIETRKTDHEPERTTITVKSGSEGNDAKVKAPTPHTGWLNVFTRPRSNITATDNGRPIDLSETQVLPVGTHQISVSRKGFVTQQHEYTIRRNETTRDTIQLERISYVKPLAFYFGAGYSVRSMSGVMGLLGAVFHGHDVQAGYTFGLSASKPVYWYAADGSYDYRSGCTYKLNSMTLRYGYQFNLSEKLAITPQVGISIDRLSVADNDAQQSYADGASATCATFGLKLLLVPIEHVYLFAAPEYDVALQKDANYKNLSSAANLSAGGFVANLGVLINF